MVVAAGLNAWRSMRLRSRSLSDRKLKNLGNWLIIAPHPDDETLGAGALIAKLVQMGVSPWIAFLTDGSASHLGAPDWSSERIARTRRREADRALHALGAPKRNRIDLGWKDSRPHHHKEPAFEKTIESLAGFCGRENIRAIATTWRKETHCDHKAAYEVGANLYRKLRGRAALFEYLVWGWTDCDLVSEATHFETFAFSDRASIGRRERALSCHRTQISPMIANAKRSFRLPDEIIALVKREPSILMRSRCGYAA